MRQKKIVILAGVMALAGAGFAPSAAMAREGLATKVAKANPRSSVAGQSLKRPAGKLVKGAHFVTEAPSGMLTNWATAVSPGLYQSATKPKTGNSGNGSGNNSGNGSGNNSGNGSGNNSGNGSGNNSGGNSHHHGPGDDSVSPD
jgi:hypothetical protein